MYVCIYTYIHIYTYIFIHTYYTYILYIHITHMHTFPFLPTPLALFHAAVALACARQEKAACKPSPTSTQHRLATDGTPIAPLQALGTWGHQRLSTQTYSPARPAEQHAAGRAPRARAHLPLRAQARAGRARALPTITSSQWGTVIVEYPPLGAPPPRSRSCVGITRSSRCGARSTHWPRATSCAPCRSRRGGTPAPLRWSPAPHPHAAPAHARHSAAAITRLRAAMRRPNFFFAGTSQCLQSVPMTFSTRGTEEKSFTSSQGSKRSW